MRNVPRATFRVSRIDIYIDSGAEGGQPVALSTYCMLRREEKRDRPPSQVNRPYGSAITDDSSASQHVPRIELRYHSDWSDLLPQPMRQSPWYRRRWIEVKEVRK